MTFDKGNFILSFTLKAASSLCVVAMLVGCSSGRDSTSKPIETGISADGQPCLTQEQKAAKMKGLKEKDSWVKNEAENTIVRGGGNFLGSLIGLGDLGEYADRANDVRKVTVKGNVSRDSIDTIRTKDCDSELPNTTNDAPAVK